MSSAPEPPSSVRHTKNGIADEEVPDHLYEDLPEHFLQTDEKGRKVPDYLRMILMCEYRPLLISPLEKYGVGNR